MFSGWLQKLSLFWCELGFLSQDLILSQWPRVNKIMTFPVILFSFSAKLHFLWVNIQSNSSIIISITIHSVLLPPVLRSSPPVLTSLFIGPLCPFPPQLQVGKEEWSYVIDLPQGEALHVWSVQFFCLLLLLLNFSRCLGRAVSQLAFSLNSIRRWSQQMKHSLSADPQLDPSAGKHGCLPQNPDGVPGCL